jgi:hypothetical protein
MRLLQIQGDAHGNEGSLSIMLHEYLGDDVPPYMILFHRWREEEVLFADMSALDLTRARKKKSYHKLETTCRIALGTGVQHIWIDTCCIDKSSSAELSEAINSMYSYYAGTQGCIAYLYDIEIGSLHSATRFTRGWTLQELIAPKEMFFYSENRSWLGTKATLCKDIAAESGIAEDVLRGDKHLDSICISEKMSWASARTTTRPEDAAYSLMGLFGVNMPTLYGEGKSKAFRRLQLEIMQSLPDHTLFAWESSTATGDMFAPDV